MDNTKRCGLVVYVHTPRHLKELRKYGTIYYFSRKMRYVVMYVDKENKAQIAEEIGELGFVKQVIDSHMSELREQLISRSTTNSIEFDKRDDEEEP
ncbi:YlbG family protein [Lentilactobacillus senioris]|uniref:YlbG family protein n=1 Tax=Lentilactobacillus senioris TaxID=931534 RepID=UPI002281C2DD|nr:YlbG family protein [Lentilactobacillus senioris]MCY9807516.1 YlbG family protein [Lentilactobacillus senioris]